MRRRGGPRPEVREERQHRSRLLAISAYEAMLAGQDGVCAICGGVDGNGRSLAVDHDHLTGVVRGLLCGRCNLGLGYFRDAANTLRAAADYLDRADHLYS